MREFDLNIKLNTLKIRLFSVLSLTLARFSLHAKVYFLNMINHVFSHRIIQFRKLNLNWQE